MFTYNEDISTHLSIYRQADQGWYQNHNIKGIQWNFSKPASTGTKNYGQFRGVAGFMRLPLQRNVQQGLKKLADIQGGPVLWGSGLEKFHCTIFA
jgi:hypothetical protein